MVQSACDDDGFINKCDRYRPMNGAMGRLSKPEETPHGGNNWHGIAGVVLRHSLYLITLVPYDHSGSTQLVRGGGAN